MQPGRRLAEPVEGRVYTAEFRLYGMLHPPRSIGISHMLNLGDRPYVPVTRCMVYGHGFTHPPEHVSLQYETEFAAIPKTRVLWMVGGNADQVSEHVSREPRVVYLMFAQYVLSGTLHLPPGQRVSDFLLTALTDRPFHNLLNARVLRPRQGVPIASFEVVQNHPFVTVNLKNAGGIFDVRGATGAGFSLEEGEI